MDQTPSIAPVAPRRRRRRPTWLRLTFRLLRIVSVAIFVLLRFVEKAIREPATWLLLGAALLAKAATSDWPI